MVSTADLEVIRNEFRASFVAYTDEGHKMLELLTRLESAHDLDSSRSLVSDQQHRLNLAQARYEEARSAYVNYVLGTLVAFRGSGMLVVQ